MKSNNCSVILKWVGSFGCAMALMQAANAQTVRMHGAVAFSNLIKSKQANIESNSGLKLEVVGNGAGRGLSDVCNGQADIALVTGTLKGVADAMNKEKPGCVDIAQVKEFPLMTSKIVVFAHPSVGVKALTDAQMRGVLTGEVKNWKEVGGADLPVKLVLPFGGDGARITMQSTLFPGVDYAKNAIIRNTAKDLCVVVSQLPGACSVSGVQNVQGNLITVATEKDVLAPWALVVKGEPSGDVKKVIEAATALIK